MIQYITKILIYSIVIYVYLNYNKKSFSICISRKNINNNTKFLAHARILASLDTEPLLSPNNCNKIKNYNKIIKKTNQNGQTIVQRIAKTPNNGYNNKYIKEKMTKEGVVKYVHIQPDLVKSNIKDVLEIKLHEYQDKKYVLKEPKISTRHKNSKPVIDSIKKQSQISLSNRYTKDNKFVLYNDYNLTKLISQHLLNLKNNNVLKNESIEEIKSYIIKNKNKLNEYVDLEKLDILKVILNNTQFNKVSPDEINIMLYYALSEHPRPHRNLPYYHDIISKDRNKLNQANIRKETTLKQNKVGKNKILLQPNTRRQKLPHGILVDTNNITNKILVDRTNLPHNILVNKNNLMNTNLVEKKNSTQKNAVRKNINDNNYTTIKDNLENKKELSSNYDLIKKQNIAKIKDESNKVHNPIEKYANTENQISHEYNNSISTGNKQYELKAVNKVRDVYGNIANDASTKQEKMIKIYMEDEKGEQQESIKKERMIKIYMEDEKGKQQRSTTKERVARINMEDKKGKQQESTTKERVTRINMEDKNGMEQKPKKKEIVIEIFMEDKKGEQQESKKKEKVTKIYMEDKNGKEQKSKKKEKVIEIFMENKKGEQQESKKKEKVTEMYMEDKNGMEQKPKKKEKVTEIYMEDKNGKEQKSKKKEKVIEIFMENKKGEQQESKKKEKVTEMYMEDKNGMEQKPKKKEIFIEIYMENKKGKEQESKKKEKVIEIFMENKKKHLFQSNIIDKKDIIMPQRENVKVLDLSPINKKKTNNNKNSDENDFIDLFDNDDEESLLTQVKDNNKIDVSIVDEIYAETERLLFEQIIGKKKVKGKYYKVKKYLKIFGLYVLPIIAATVSISLLGLQISTVMATDIFSGSLITAGKTTIVEGGQCLANAATDVMEGLATEVFPAISFSDFSFSGLFDSFITTLENTAIVGMKTVSNTTSCVSDSMIPKTISAATTYGVSVAFSQILYPMGIAINIAIIIYIITKIIVKLDDMGKFNKLHKYRKKVINKLKKKINTKKKRKKKQ
ncbi:hypothetical protein Py17XNL_000504611 [Plasmodium yoelii yoelii]|uniref:Uncharacterized protein n=1 Tax=Plasmodium yoelii yoelii TaxID=73239 RepID=A0AAF0B395_PLAYO|nr:hypothetical protein Py17XNL_000504611 [Plasmodium yoelii yoelii]